MQLALAVQCGYTVDELPECRDEPIVESRGLVRAPHVVDEAHARHELHGEEAALVLDEQLVEAHQVGVRHVGEASELPFQPVEVGGTGPQREVLSATISSRTRSWTS